LAGRVSKENPAPRLLQAGNTGVGMFWRKGNLRGINGRGNACIDLTERCHKLAETRILTNTRCRFSQNGTWPCDLRIVEGMAFWFNVRTKRFWFHAGR
jgi:hypothetical protein